MRSARILLADDHTLVIEGMRAIVEPQHEIAGVVADGRALLEAASRLKPDLIVLDITMPLLNGIDAAEQISKTLPGIKLLFVTMHVNPAYLEAALNAGADGYVLKSAAREDLLSAIEVVLSGGTYITPHLSPRGWEGVLEPARVAASLRLSRREREILQLVAEGRSTKEMAFILKVSVKTIAFHRQNIKRKLGLRTTAELTRHAIEEGLI